jgi:hypothetical protein
MAVGSGTLCPPMNTVWSGDAANTYSDLPSQNRSRVSFAGGFMGAARRMAALPIAYCVLIRVHWSMNSIVSRNATTFTICPSRLCMDHKYVLLWGWPSLSRAFQCHHVGRWSQS